MPFGQSAIIGVVVAEVADLCYMNRQGWSNEERSWGKAVTCAVSGCTAAVLTSDPVGGVGTLVLSTGYVGHYKATGEVLMRNPRSPARSS